ncbi:MAG: hypothetical protein RR060_02130 [Victivallaceae bacterium]
MEKNKFFLLAGTTLAAVGIGGLGFALNADESVSSQPDQPAQYVMMAGKLDVTSEFNGQPYTMNTMVLLNTQTGKMWLLQTQVNQSNNPVINNANLIPVNFSNGPTDPQALLNSGADQPGVIGPANGIDVQQLNQ